MSRDCCTKRRDLVLLLCKELGWVLFLEKSELVPQQVFTFVGIHYDLTSFTAHPTLENWIKVTWQSIIGIIQGQLCLVPSPQEQEWVNSR